MRTGSLIGLGFGWLWWLAGTGVVAGFPGSVLQVLGILIFAVSGIWIVKRRPQAAHRQPRWAYYVAAIVVEIAAIALAQAWLTARGLEPLLFPVIGIIVGLHFTGLWPAFGRRRFLVLAGAMIAINLLALLLPLEPDTRLMLSGFGSSACLLATALLRKRIKRGMRFRSCLVFGYPEYPNTKQRKYDRTGDLQSRCVENDY